MNRFLTQSFLCFLAIAGSSVAGAQTIYGAFEGTMTSGNLDVPGSGPLAGNPIVGNFSASYGTCFNLPVSCGAGVTVNFHADSAAFTFGEDPAQPDSEFLSFVDLAVTPSGQTFTTGNSFYPFGEQVFLSFLGAPNAFAPNNNVTAQTFGPGVVTGGTGSLGGKFVGGNVHFDITSATLSTSPLAIPDVPTPLIPNNPVPEPSTYAILLGGGLALAWASTRRRRAEL